MVEIMEIGANGALCKYAMKPIIIATDTGSTGRVPSDCINPTNLSQARS